MEMTDSCGGACARRPYGHSSLIPPETIDECGALFMVSRAQPSEGGW
jgi:hypothetical protein